uniref:Uncharacterized protein n=1 Tax=Rhizophora mucronata TaxID=61149 RepID=A0A2P2QDV8_RHIMU
MTNCIKAKDKVNLTCIAFFSLKLSLPCGRVLCIN